MRSRFKRLAALSLTVAVAGTANAGVVSDYRINGTTVHEGASFQAFRTVAGDPVLVEPVAGNPRYVESVHRCERAGAGRCDVVGQGGRREMRRDSPGAG